MCVGGTCVTYLVLTATSQGGRLLLPFLGQGKLRHREDKKEAGWDMNCVSLRFGVTK